MVSFRTRQAKFFNSKLGTNKEQSLGNVSFEILQEWNDKNKLSELVFGIRKLLNKPDEPYAYDDSRAFNAYMCDVNHYKKKAREWTKKFAWDSEWIDEK